MIRINPLFFIVFAIVCAVGLLPQFMTVFIVALLHESAHAISARLCGYKDVVFCIQPWGVCMKCKSYDNPFKEFIITSAGPVINLLLLIAGGIFRAQELCVANLFMLVINLLPVYPLDGGRILKTMLVTELGASRSEVVMKCVSVTITVAMFICGCFLLYRTGLNFSVLAASLFLCFTSDKVDSENNCEVLKKSVHYTVKSEQKADSILNRHIKKDRVIFDITDTSERYLGSVTYRQVLEEIAVCGYEIKFGEILEKQLLY